MTEENGVTYLRYSRKEKYEPSFFFWLHPQQAEVPGPGIKLVPQQLLEPQQ